MNGVGWRVVDFAVGTVHAAESPAGATPLAVLGNLVALQHIDAFDVRTVEVATLGYR